jgi:hypothetical protein
MRELDVIVPQKLHCLSREPTAWLVRCAFHKEHNFALIHQSSEAYFELIWRLLEIDSVGRRCGCLSGMRKRYDGGQYDDVLGDCVCEGSGICAVNTS